MVYNIIMLINGKDIYQRIIDMLEMRDIKKIDFCTKIGITRQNMAKWKSGSLPSIDILYAIKEELKISLDWLLTGQNIQDTTDPSAPYQIVNRIDDSIERKTGHKVWEKDFDFYSSIKDIVHEQELADWLYGRQIIDISKVAKIADRIGESVQYLITGSQISKAEYVRYYMPKEPIVANLLHFFSPLNEENKNYIQKTTELVFFKQYGKDK